MRLIDLNKIPHKAFCGDRDDLVDALWAAPTVDAVPVVRKPVKGFEGYYEVDCFGRVYGLDRVIYVDDNGRKYEKPVSAKKLSQTVKSNGYKVVTLTKDGVSKAFYVHRIVAEAFIPNPNNLPMVNHKDEDRANNFVENLEWCTAQYNRVYGNAIENHAKKIRGRESEKRVKVIAHSLDGKKTAIFESMAEAARQFNGSTSAISAVCKGKRKSAYGMRWEYYGERKRGDE